jgi:nucleoside-diphosphate-sugar epimerase
MSPSKSLRIPQGETVLVTGANGYIATHIVDTLLDQGYNVRGTVRSEKPWLNKYFDGKYGKGRFETRILAVLEKEGALDEVVKGVAGIIHAVRF